MLLFPIIVKLFFYYNAVPEYHSKITAINLHNSVQKGDVVTFTGTRGIVDIYYLYKLGYQWNKNKCIHTETKRVFYCLFYPSTTTDQFIYNAQPLLNDKNIIREEVEKMLQLLSSDSDRLFVVFDGGYIDDGVIQLAPQDYYLVEELKYNGFIMNATDDPLIFLFKH